MTQGIHHITCIASDPRKTIDFYAGVLGLRLVKKSVNQDDASAYHLFFGDRLGHPGLDLTFFIFRPHVAGTVGTGMVSNVSLAIPATGLVFWEERLTGHGISVRQESRLGLERLVFADPDGLPMEMVGLSDTELSEDAEPWIHPGIPDHFAVRHFFSAGLSVRRLSDIEPILTRVFGFEHSRSHGPDRLYVIPGSRRASAIEVHEHATGASGNLGSGTVHHLAFRASGTLEQSALVRKAVELGLKPTDVINRFYFRSVYMRTNAGLLLEIATDGPGFTIDESEETLGTALCLPPNLSTADRTVAASLPDIG